MTYDLYDVSYTEFFQAAENCIMFYFHVINKTFQLHKILNRQQTLASFVYYYIASLHFTHHHVFILIT